MLFKPVFLKGQLYFAVWLCNISYTQITGYNHLVQSFNIPVKNLFATLLVLKKCAKIASYDCRLIYFSTYFFLFLLYILRPYTNLEFYLLENCNIISSLFSSVMIFCLKAYFN